MQAPPTVSSDVGTTDADLDQHQIFRTAIGGIPCFWADVPGPLHAALLFRVGRIDETLQTAGLTHAVEHLSLARLMSENFDFNAHVEVGFTMFYATGRPQDISRFLNAATEGLRDLPLDRVESEFRILTTEAANQGQSVAQALFDYRYGPRGPGLIAYREFGFNTSGPNDVAAWSRQAFTAGNACLLFTGPIPDDLDVSFNPGPRLPFPNCPPIQQALPAWFAHRFPAVGFGMLAPRTAAATLLEPILEARLKDRLRMEMGVTYGVGVGSELVGPDTIHLHCVADVHAEHFDEASEAMVAVVEELARSGPTDEEFARQHDRYERVFGDQRAVSGLLYAAARDELLHRPYRSLSQRLDDLRAVQPADISGLLYDVLHTSIWALPDGSKIPHSNLVPIPRFSDHRVQGREHAAVPEGSRNPIRTLRAHIRGPKLVVGDQGVTVLDAESRPVTVRFDRCEAVLAWTNGDRVLVGFDGMQVVVAPQRWVGGQTITAFIDAHVPHHRYIPMG